MIRRDFGQSYLKLGGSGATDRSFIGFINVTGGEKHKVLEAVLSVFSNSQIHKPQCHYGNMRIT